MITKKMIKDGIENGTVKFVVDPNLESGTVCQIGLSWFYFGGLPAEEMDPEDYLKAVPVDVIVMDIYDVLQDFLKSEFTYDEYRFYEAMLQPPKMTHMLITVCEREITTEKFPSLLLAQEAMKKELIQEGKAPEDIAPGYDDGDCGLGDYQAYANDGVNHNNYDWLIASLD